MQDDINIAPIEQYVIDFVIRLRKQRDLNQDDIATILNVRRTFVTNVESSRNRAKYNLTHIAKLADHLGLSPKDFLPEDVTL